MEISSSPVTSLRHLIWTRSTGISMGLLLVALLSPASVFLAAMVLAGIAAAYFTASGRLSFESNRNYVWWLARIVTERTTADPQGLAVDLCRQGGLSSISPIRTAEVPYWYSPKRLQPVAEAFLAQPPEVVLYLVNRILPGVPGPVLGIEAHASALAGDLMMTLERMYVLNAKLGDAAAYVLAMGVLAAPSLAAARRTLRNIGQTEAASEQLRAEMAVADSQMNRAVRQALHRLDPTLAAHVVR